MKKQIIIALALSVSAFSFAQKKELKTADKAIKAKNYAEAKAALKEAEAFMSSMDDKLKAQYYYLNSEALYSNGAGSINDIDAALESLNKVQGDYVVESAQLKQAMVNGIITKGNKFYENKDYSTSSKYFEKAYRLSVKDTMFLYYAAATAVSVKEYNRALVLYEELKDLGYTGIEKQFYATDIAKNEEELFSNKGMRDISVKAKTHSNPGERKTESKKPEIVKNIALIYISNGDNEKALSAIKDARVENPDNVDLIINEANIYMQLKDENKFKELIEEAITKDPDNKILHYNVGVVSMNKGDMDKAQTSFEKALSIDPSYSDAALNISNIFIEKGNLVIKDMGKLGMSKADDAKYEKLKVEKNDLFQKGAQVLIDFIGKNPDANVDIFTQLKNIYSALGDTAKSKEIEAKIDAMVGGE